MSIGLERNANNLSVNSRQEGVMPRHDFVDDRTIEDSSELWRRVHPEFLVRDDNGRIFPSSQAFQNRSKDDPMSVGLADICPSPAEELKGYADYGLASLSAGQVRRCQQVVCRAPLEATPWHAHVCGDKPRRIRKQLAKVARWVVPPPVS